MIGRTEQSLLTNLMDGIIAVFFVNKGIENTDVLFSLFLASGPSPVWKQKDTYQACVNDLCFAIIYTHSATVMESSFIKYIYLCLCFCMFKVMLPLPKCLRIKASPRIIWPHRNIHPHPVSDVGPVPPVTHSRITQKVTFGKWKPTWIKSPNLSKGAAPFPLLSLLTNRWEVFSVCEPQSWSDIW